MIIKSAHTDLFGVDMLPALDALIHNEYNRRPPQFSKVFRVLTSTREIEQTTQLSGLGLIPQVDDGDALRYDNPVQGFDKTYEHTQFGLGFRITKVTQMNDRHAISSKMGRDLGRSARETVEITVAAHFNNGFTAGAFAGPDGVALFSASHPQVKAGGVQSNTMAAADLEVESLQLATTQFRKMKDSSGRLIRIPLSRVIVAPEEEWNVIEILGGNMRSDTANNTINAFINRNDDPNLRRWMVWDYLTDPDSWFIAGDPEDTELRFYWRERFNVSHDMDFDTRSQKTAGWMQHSSGWSDYYGVLGVPGA